MKCQEVKNGYGLNDRRKLLHEIDKVSFAIVEMVEYLDTHPYEKEAIEYLNHYNRLRNQLMREYASKYGALTVDLAAEENCGEWNWALQKMPWKGGCD